MSREPADDQSLNNRDLDERVDQLVAYDEQLRDGTARNLASAITVLAKFDDEASSLVDCLHLLERAWPRQIPPETVRISKSIGRFQLESVLGVGGFGIVYKAYDPILKRNVALKVPKLQSMGSRNLLARFEREARAAASLDHPNIVPIHETGHAGPICYIAATYCSGSNLAEWLKGRTTAVPERLAVMLVHKLANAIQYSHSKGVLHRDLKPSNVLLVPETIAVPDDELPFTPRLTDFGLAKLMEDDLEASLTRVETQALGTPSYMAPEQTGKLEFAIGPPTDVYGLGIILYELLTGSPPFQGANVADVFDQIKNHEPFSPRHLRRELSADIETICLKCLEKNPKQRFQTAQDLADDLGRYLRRESIKSRPVSPIVRCLRWCRKNPTATALVGVSVGAVLAIVGLLAVHSNRLTKLNLELIEIANRAKVSQRIAEENEGLIQDALYASDISRAAAAWKGGDSRVMIDLLDRQIPKPGEPDRRGFEWWFLKQQARRSHRVLLDVGSALYMLKASPDQRLMAAVGADAIVRLFDPVTGSIQTEILTGQSEINGLAFSPDGMELATAGDDGTVRFWNLSTCDERLKIKSNVGKSYQIVFTLNGREIICCGDDTIIRVFDTQSGTERSQLAGHSREVQSLAISTDGKTLASTSTDNTARFWDLGSGTLERIFIHDKPLGSLLFHKDLDLLICGSDHGELISVRLSTNRPLAQVQLPDSAESLALHPDGKTLAVGTSGGSISLWKVAASGEITKFPLEPWQAHQGRVYSLSWSADGSGLLSAGQDGRVLTWCPQLDRPANPRTIEIDGPSTVCLIPGTEVLIQSRFPPNVLDLTTHNWRTGAKLKTIVSDGIHEVEATRDGQFVAGIRDSRELRLFRAGTAADGNLELNSIARWEAPGKLQSLRCSPDSKRIAVSHWYRPNPEQPAEHFVWLFDILDLTKREQIPIPNSSEMAFTPNGRHLLLTSEGRLTLWDLDGRRIVWEIPNAERVHLVFSPDGRLIATGGVERIVVIRDAIDGAILFRLSGHSGHLRSLVFSPDSRTLVTADSKGSLKLWNVASGQEMLELGNANKVCERIDFSADGRQLFLHQWFSIPPPKQGYNEIMIFDASEGETR